MVLARRSGLVRPRFLIGTLIQNHGTPVGQGRGRLALGLYLLDHRGARPRRVGHEVLQGLPIPSMQGALHVGKVAFGVHSQLRPQIVVGMRAGVARTGRKTTTKAQPELREAVPQVGDRFRRQAPASGGLQRQLATLIGRGRLVRRRPFPLRFAQPAQSSPSESLFQGPLGGRCHGSILCTVVEHSGLSQRLLEGFPHAMLHPRRSRSERHSLVHDSKTVSLRPADYSFNVTLSSYHPMA